MQVNQEAQGKCCPACHEDEDYELLDRDNEVLILCCNLVKILEKLENS